MLFVCISVLCFVHSGVTAYLEDVCPVSENCRRTCAEPNPPNCLNTVSMKNINGCDCRMGFILSKKGGDCIRIEECDEGCNGDPNAVVRLFPQTCPATCEVPEATYCEKTHDPIGCGCKYGYILSNETGRCISINSCPGGNPCGQDEQFLECKSECPQDFCPVDDNRGLILCDPFPVCESGCICNLNYKRKSYDDPQCIVSSDCPPVKCTRPNEVWDSCPPACLRENCEDVDKREDVEPTDCNTFELGCQPACVCEKNYFRNATNFCIPAKDCQLSEDNWN